MRYIIQNLIVFLLLGCQLPPEPSEIQIQQKQTETREVQIEQKICTEVGCKDVLSLIFDPPISSTGNYIFQFSYSNGSRLCEYHLSVDDKDFCGNDIFVIRKDINSQEAKTNFIKPISGMEISMAPKTFTLNITRDGKRILMQSHSPIYSEYYPNGADCPPTCKSGQQRIQIPNNF